MSNKNNISIIIPTLNEEKNIQILLSHLTTYFPLCEIIVVDGGSTDNTVAFVQKYAQVVHSPKGRGKQLNVGAKQATGEFLWFLHADTIPHIDSVNLIQKVLQDPSLIGGAFQYNLGSTSIILQFLSWYSNLKNKTFNRIYGDMGIFVRKDAFEKIDCFSECHLMEDYDFSKRIKKIGNITILPQQITTSPRDWYKEGFIKKILKDTFIKTAYRLHVDNKKLYNWYYGVKR